MFETEATNRIKRECDMGFFKRISELDYVWLGGFKAVTVF